MVCRATRFAFSVSCGYDFRGGNRRDIMASGWDKSPGPDNDYASGPWSAAGTIGLVALMLAVFGAIGALALFS